MMSTRPPKPSKYHSWSREEGKWLTQGQISYRRDRMLEENPGEYFDIEAGLDSPPMLLSTHSFRNMNMAVGGSVPFDAENRGSEWEELLHEATRNVVQRDSARGIYYHYAQLIVSQEYELCRLGVDRRASRKRLAWALHAQCVGEREIARACEVSRHEIRKYLAELDDTIHFAIDNDDTL